jgi:hypothetical protein
MIALRMNSEQERIVKEKAHALGLSISGFARMAALQYEPAGSAGKQRPAVVNPSIAPGVDSNDITS